MNVYIMFQKYNLHHQGTEVLSIDEVVKIIINNFNTNNSNVVMNEKELK